MDRRGNQRSLVIDMEVDECLQITAEAGATTDDQTVSVTMLAKSGKRARLRVVAAPGVKVRRVGQKIPAAA